MMRVVQWGMMLGATMGPLTAQPRGPMGYGADFKPTHRDLSYAELSPAQKLDLFLPDGEGPFPLVINLHGGAFRMGSKEMLDEPVAKAFLKAGVAVATVSYRLSGEARFPAAVLDAKAAVRFLRGNAETFHLDGKRFVAFGQSAGGNLASMLGTSGGVAAFDDPALGNSGVSSRVQGVVDWFGPTDFAQMDAQAEAQGCPESSRQHGRADSPEGQYLGGALAAVPELCVQANPMTYITPDDPPFLLQKGDRDCVVPVGQTRMFFESLKAGGVKAEMDILQGAGHGDMGSPQPVFLSEKNIQRVVAFVKSAVAAAP